MSSLAALLDIPDTLGAAFIGFGFSCAAFGVNSNQVITYFARYPEDKLGYKLLVVLIWCLACFDQAFIGHAVYFYTIKNYANPAVLLERVAWTLIVQLIVGALIGTIVRLCFAMRVWRFSQRNIPVTALIIALTLGEFGLAVAYAVRCFQNPFLTVLPNLKLLASLALGAGALTDITIAVALSFFLRRYRTGSKRADSLVTSLTVYAVNTGAFSAAVSLSTLVLYDLFPTDFRFLAFYFILCKIYAISFLCTLNTRRIIRGKGTERSDGRSEPQTGRSSGGARFLMSNGASPRTQTNTHTLGTSAKGDVSLVSMSKGGLEVGVHQEVSIVSDVEEGQSDRDKFEGEYSPTTPHAYAYSPSTSPTYAYASRSPPTDYGWGRAMSANGHDEPKGDAGAGFAGWGGNAYSHSYMR